MTIMMKVEIFHRLPPAPTGRPAGRRNWWSAVAAPAIRWRPSRYGLAVGAPANRWRSRHRLGHYPALRVSPPSPISSCCHWPPANALAHTPVHTHTASGNLPQGLPTPPSAPIVQSVSSRRPSRSPALPFCPRLVCVVYVPRRVLSFKNYKTSTVFFFFLRTKKQSRETNKT